MRVCLGRSELDLGEARKKIVSFIQVMVKKAGADGVVLGLSGGIDSTVTAYLSVEALGSRRVFGLIMPDQRVTPRRDVEDAKQVADELGISSRLIDIAPIHRTYMRNLEENRLAEGNLRARIRMALLYYFANAGNRLVVGTGDKSEELLGYFTKYGDGGADIMPIADLYKTEVRKLGEILGVTRRIVSKSSSPRLWLGQTAEGELGMPYEVIDSILRLRFEEGKPIGEISSVVKVDARDVRIVLSRVRTTSHKRRTPAVCRLR